MISNKKKLFTREKSTKIKNLKEDLIIRTKQSISLSLCIFNRRQPQISVDGRLLQPKIKSPSLSLAIGQSWMKSTKLSFSGLKECIIFIISFTITL